jgi:hypothetical protein
MSVQQLRHINANFSLQNLSFNPGGFIYVGLEMGYMNIDTSYLIPEHFILRKLFTAPYSVITIMLPKTICLGSIS